MPREMTLGCDTPPLRSPCRQSRTPGQAKHSTDCSAQAQSKTHEHKLLEDRYSISLGEKCHPQSQARRRIWCNARTQVPSHSICSRQNPNTESRRGSNVIVIHPGSRWLRVGRAMDVNPTSVPNVIARKHKPPVPEPTFTERISRPRVRRLDPSSLATSTSEEDEYAVHALSDDPVCCSNDTVIIHSARRSCPPVV